MTDFPTRPLRELARLSSGGTPSKSNPAYWGGAVPWLTPKDMARFDGTTQDSVTKEAIGNGTRQAPAGSIFIAVRGMSLHNEIRIVRPAVRMAFNQDVKAVAPEASVDGRFLHYAMLARVPDLRDAVEAAGHGTGVLPTDRLSDLPIPALPLPEQRAIAATLGALDDKIELNRKMNATLKAMARALFRDWFVDFGPTRAKMECRAPYLTPDLWSLFPDRLGAEGKPEGWEVSSIGALTHRITKGTTPTKQQITAALDAPSINFLRVNNLSDEGKLSLGNTVQIAQSVHEGALKRSMLEQDDLLYSIAGTIGRVTKTPQEILPANVNQAIAIIRANPELVPPNYLLMWLSDADFQNELHSNIVQAVQANLSLGMLSEARILAPPRETLTKLFRPIDALLESKAHNERESRTLAQTRDLLLPRLMSGELRVADALSKLETA